MISLYDDEKTRSHALQVLGHHLWTIKNRGRKSLKSKQFEKYADVVEENAQLRARIQRLESEKEQLQEENRELRETDQEWEDLCEDLIFENLQMEKGSESD